MIYSVATVSEFCASQKRYCTIPNIVDIMTLPHAKSNGIWIAKQSGSIEKNAVNTVLRDSWQQTLKKNSQIADLLESHVRRMRTLFGNIDYEIYVVENILANIGNASRDEVEKYLRFVEALAFGYVKMLGKDIASITLHGVVARSRSVKAISKYYRSMTLSLGSKTDRLKAKYESRKGKINRMSYNLKIRERSFFSFLDSNNIRRLRYSIDKRSQRLSKLEAQIIEYATLQSNIQTVLDRSQFIKED